MRFTDGAPGRLALAATLFAFVAASPSKPNEPAPNLTLEKLAPNVYAAIRTEPLGLAVNANSLIIVRDVDVVVVDAQFLTSATREPIAAIRGVTKKPVRWVVNTHWHDDHLAGDQVYRDSFPGVRFAQHANTVADLVALGEPNRKGTAEGAPPLADRFEKLLGMGLGIDSTPASEGERASVTNAIRIIREYVAELPNFRAVVVTDTVRDRLTIPGKPAVEVRYFGNGNTRGDLVVSVPSLGIVASGDLVVAPIPFAFNSNPREWVGVLDSLVGLEPRILVPGHGPVMRELTYVRSVRRMLDRINAEVAASVAQGDSLRATLRSVTLEDERVAMTHDEKWLNSMFRDFFVGPAVQRAYAEAKKGGTMGL
jgi:glyoxylase-like metal-dependent hydrolase (beta-lactamase superfamily II)